MKISVVIPAFNEQGNIGRLVEETLNAVSSAVLGEIIVVDDCSDDGTQAEIEAMMAKSDKVRHIRHQSRAGQSTALKNGVWAAKFDVIATMDGDGQNDPADIETLLGLLDTPGDGDTALVGGVRANRRAAGSRRFASRFANGLRSWMLKDECPDTGCGIKVFWRNLFVRLPYFTSMHRYLPAMVQTYGYKTAYSEVNDRERVAGQSKYTNLGRALIGIYDLFGVTWLRRRTKAPQIAETQSSD